jgi:hypothetical protein
MRPLIPEDAECPPKPLPEDRLLARKVSQMLGQRQPSETAARLTPLLKV